MVLANDGSLPNEREMNNNEEEAKGALADMGHVAINEQEEEDRKNHLSVDEEELNEAGYTAFHNDRKNMDQ